MTITKERTLADKVRADFPILHQKLMANRWFI